MKGTWQHPVCTVEWLMPHECKGAPGPWVHKHACCIAEITTHGHYSCPYSAVDKSQLLKGMFFSSMYVLLEFLLTQTGWNSPVCRRPVQAFKAGAEQKPLSPAVCSFHEFHPKWVIRRFQICCFLTVLSLKLSEIGIIFKTGWCRMGTRDLNKGVSGQVT